MICLNQLSINPNVLFFNWTTFKKVGDIYVAEFTYSPTQQKIDLKKYCTDSVGLLTLEDIIKELEKPGLDIREQAKVFTFNQNIKTINDLRDGQLLPGVVNNITNFGCFVDVGIKESGLIHVSNLSDSFVKDVNEHVSLHQQIIVKVLEVDIPRKRIQLKLHK